VARVSYLRPVTTPVRVTPRGSRGSVGDRPRRFGRGPFIALGVLVVALIGVVVAGALVATSHASLSSDSSALADITLPVGGGKIESVSVTTGPHSRRVPAELRGVQIWPLRRIRVHQRVTIDVTLRRPGWIAWLSGRTEHLRLTLLTPSAAPRERYLTLRGGAPIVLHFNAPIQAIAYGPPGQISRRDLVTPLSTVRLHRTAPAGTLWVAAMPRTWETASPVAVSWFPAGAAASAVATPAPGTVIGPHTKLSLTFSRTVGQVLGRTLPPVTPAGAGNWTAVNSHTITFTPVGYGYGLGAKVNVGLPGGVQIIGAQGASATWKVPGGSTLRIQQILAQLGYLPLHFDPAHQVAATPDAQEQAAVAPPAGHFVWRYPNVPDALRSMWSPGSAGVVTQGALMSFENDHGLTTDGVAGPAVWKALINAAVSGKASSFGYTFVSVHKNSSPQSLTVWHSGQNVVSPPVNTGIASAPTASGTYPVFEHVPVTTMSGTNPDGSHYSDPGIQYVSYFNGGDALHAFTRGQYGFPQSLGCVEMDLASAARVYPYTPIGTLVHVE
jgi:peptidoglycan hydrolase-like protein with peptidoglycan-binding domain